MDILGGIAQQMQQQNVDVFLTNEDTFLRVESAIFSMVKKQCGIRVHFTKVFFLGGVTMNYQGFEIWR